MRLNREDITARIPHAGRMVLLDEVSEWDKGRIVCRSAMHQDRSNALYVGGQLASVCAIEFAAQAMAVHGSLLVHPDRASLAGNQLTSKPRAGFLASVRNVHMAVSRLDNVRSVLTIEANHETGDDTRVIYRFEVRAGADVLVSGRAAVVLEMPEQGQPA